MITIAIVVVTIILLVVLFGKFPVKSTEQKVGNITVLERYLNTTDNNVSYNVLFEDGSERWFEEYEIGYLEEGRNYTLYKHTDYVRYGIITAILYDTVNKVDVYRAERTPIKPFAVVKASEGFVAK